MAQHLFARGELGWAAVEALRRAGKPLSVAEIARRVLDAKGISTPDAAALRRVRVRLQWALFALDKAGVTTVETKGPGARRGLSQSSFLACLSADGAEAHEYDQDVLTKLRKVSGALRKAAGANPAASFELRDAALFVMTQLLEDAQDEISRLRAGIVEPEGDAI